MADNSVTLTGNMTREPELRFTASGQAVSSFGLAVNRRWQKDGEWQEQASFFDVTVWGQMAENVGQLPKGSRVTVFGRLQQSTWEKDGEKKSKVEVVADDVAVSLKWATVTIEKNERTKPGPRGSETMKPSYDEEPF